MRARLFLEVFTIEARKLMSYRADFWVNTLVGSLASFALVYILWSAIFVETGQIIAGYSFDGMVLYYVLAILLGRLITGSGKPLDVGQEIYDGTLSRYLLFPAPYLPVKFAQRLGLLLPSLVQLVLLFGAYWIFLPRPAEVEFTAVAVVQGCLALCMANVLYYSITVVLQLAAFWADNVWSLVIMMVFVSRLLGGAMVPLDTFPASWQPVLAALPFRYCFGFTIDTLMGRIPTDEWVLGMGVGLLWIGVMCAVGRFVWHRGMLRYSGVGI